MYPGVIVAGVPSGGLDRSRLRAELAAWLRETGLGPDGTLTDQAVVFTDPATGRQWTCAGSSLGLGIDVEATLKRAYACGRAGTVLGALAGLIRCSARGAWVPPAVVVDAARLDRVLLDLAADVNVAPAAASLEPRTGEVRPGHPGRLLDLAATRRSLLTVMEVLGRERPSGPIRFVAVPLAVTDVPPRGDPARLAALTRDRLSTFTTTFDASETGRAWNIALACARLDGAIIEPGAVLSFNGLVGARTPENGFREAPEIVGYSLVPGFGGGVCQVASTVFNAALLADLDVVERHHHSLPLEYVGLGRDATVSYPNLDLVVGNPRAFPVILTALAHRGEVIVSFWGRRTVEGEVTLLTEELNLKPAECVTEVRSDLPAGTRVVVETPFDGRDVRLWRVVRQGGQVVRRELVWVDHYEPIAGLVQVGPPAAAGGPVSGPGSDTGESGHGAGRRQPRGPR